LRIFFQVVVFLRLRPEQLIFESENSLFLNLLRLSAVAKRKNRLETKAGREFSLNWMTLT